MDLRVMDVAQGDCILVLSSQNEAVLIDCGYNSATKWRPSSGLAMQGFGSRRRLHHLILTHPDADHLADLHNVLEQLKPVHVWQHPQIDTRSLSELKVTVTRAKEAYLRREKSSSELQPLEASRQFRTMQLRQFYLPLGSVRDVNDLSLVSFITEDGFTVCFPGDLSAIGWRKHLKNEAFRFMLRETNLFFASHHGRPTGYCPEIFEYLQPRLIVISDKELTTAVAVAQRVPYREHARGVQVEDGSYRRVLTTRSDGRIRVVVTGAKWQVSTSKTRKPGTS